MKLRWVQRAGVAVGSSALSLLSCSDDSGTPVGNGGSGGSTTSGSSAGGATSGGTGTSGNPTGGKAGSATGGQGGVSGSAGTAGGSSGSGGVAGTAGTSGTTSGSAGDGGASGGEGGVAGESSAGAGGQGGEGGAAEEPFTLLYDFEADAQGWTASDVDTLVSVDAAQFVTGAKSLKVVVPLLAAGTSRTVAVRNAHLWPGARVRIHVWAPLTTDLYVQAFSQSNNWKTWDVAGNGGATLVAAGWTTLEYTVPQTFPGGLQQLGVQIGAQSSAAFAGGVFFIDSVSVSGGVEECAGTGSGTYGFETANIEPWQIDGNPTVPDTALAQSTTQAKSGTGALKVSFTALPLGTPEAATPRRIFAYAPSAFCGDQVSFDVWTPVGSEALRFQAFSQSDNYGVWNSDLPVTATPGGWTHVTYTIPAIDAGGLQRVGIQFLNTGAAFTGDVYIDDVSW